MAQRIRNIVMEPEPNNHFPYFNLLICSFLYNALQDTLFEGSMSRDQVAVEPFFCKDSFYKMAEIVSPIEAPKCSLEDLLGAVRQK